MTNSLIDDYLSELDSGKRKPLKEHEIRSITSRPRLRAEILWLKEQLENRGVYEHD